MKKVYILLAVGGMVGVIVAILIFKPTATHQQVQPVSTAATTTPGIPARTIPPGMREFKSDAYKFSLLYPEELHVVLRDEGKGASTIIFQNLQKKEEGFQIFVVPYAEPQISDARFKKDIPSGVRTDLRAVMIGGESGAAFYSYDASLGDTAEVWLLHRGYLFEVTTLRPLGGWVSTILQHWEFI